MDNRKNIVLQGLATGDGKDGSFKVLSDDKQDDDDDGSIDSNVKTISQKVDNESQNIDADFSEDILETPEEKKQRKRSHLVLYFTMLLMSMGFSIVLTGVYPYMMKVDAEADKKFYGVVVAANPLGQIIFSPLIGIWVNKRGSIRLPCMICCGLFVLGSTMYSLIDLFPEGERYWMLVSRFIVGVSSASIAACRACLGESTTVAERTQAMSIISLCQSMGYILGPALQSLLTPIGEEGVCLGPFPLNMYTVASWINVLLGIINFILFLPAIFQERRIAVKESELKVKKLAASGKGTGENILLKVKPDYLIMCILLFAFFVMLFNYVLIETLGTPMTKDEFAWTDKEAILYNGILLSVGSVLSCISYIMMGRICKRFDERLVMLVGGFIPMIVGRLLYIPWGPDIPIINNSTSVEGNITVSLSCIEMMNQDSDDAAYMPSYYGIKEYSFAGVTFRSMADETVSEDLGCPVNEQPWCEVQLQMTIVQWILGWLVMSIGYPFGSSLINVFISKMLGPRPQGLWMGLITASGCVARAMAPIFVAQIYTDFGPTLTFSITCTLMAVTGVFLIPFYKRIVPLEKAVEKGRIKIP